jgi:hypothetical protein
MRPGNEPIRTAARIHRLYNLNHKIIWNDDDRKRGANRISLLVPEWWFCDSCGEHWDTETQSTFDCYGKRIPPPSIGKRIWKNTKRFCQHLDLNWMSFVISVVALGGILLK